MAPLISVCSLFGLLALVLWLYNDLRVDRYRQDLFATRDRLFDEAAAGVISFDSSAYRVTRAMMNGLIRFGHRVSLSGMVLTMATRNTPSATAAEREIQQAYRAASQADRDLCDRYMAAVHLATARHLASSPLMIVLSIPALMSRLLAALARPLRALDVSAYSEGTAAA